jgi:hypothetical protein
VTALLQLLVEVVQQDVGEQRGVAFRFILISRC